MDKILQGILISDHPEPLKDKLIQKIIMQAEQEQESQGVRPILELSVRWSLHGSSRFEFYSGVRLYSEWSKYNVTIVKELFTQDYLIQLMTQTCENPNVVLILFDKTLTVLDETTSYSVLTETFSKLCIDFLENNLNLECLYILVQILNKFPQCTPHERISDLSQVTIEILSKTEIPEDYSDKIYLLKKTNLIADFLKKIWHQSDMSTVEDCLLKLFVIISSPDTQPSQCLGGIISCLPLKMVGEIFNLAHMPDIGDVHLSRAVIRIISWLQWPTSRHVNVWVIAIFEELEFMKKYDMLVDLTEKNIEFLFNCLKIVLSRDEALKILSHLLLRCQRDPAPFHKIIKFFPGIVNKLKAEKSISSNHCLQDLIELFHVLMYIHSGFPELYDPILEIIAETPPELNFIKEVIEKYSSKRWGSSSNTVVALKSRDYLSMSPTKKIGLHNFANTCYMNCIIQVLFLIDDFRRHILKLSSTNKQILYETQRLFSFLLSSQRPAISPTSFYEVSNPSWFNIYEHQDCMEFFSFLIQKLDEEKSLYGNNGPKNLGHYFSGKIRNLFHCDECMETVVQNNDSFNTMNLAFPTKREHEYELSTLLDYYFQLEEMVGNDKINCPICDIPQNGQRWVEIIEPPQYLKLILMRFSYDNVLRKKVKIMNRVRYPIELSIPVVDIVSNETKLLLYVLCSVTIHSGSSSDSGHYYCFGRHSSVVNLNPSRLGDILKDEWFLFNDERVTYTEFITSQKLGCYPQHTPYLLVYRLVDDELLDSTADEVNMELDQSFIPLRFQNEIRKDNAAYRKEEENAVKVISTGNKRKRDFDPNERGPPGSCGGGGGDSSFSQIDASGAKFIF